MRPKADTQAIAVFVRVVESRGFTSAAKALGLTPSGASRIVSRLEQELGVRLLHRTTRSLSLTDDGAAFYERCARILAELAEAEAAVGESAHSPRGRLRVDAPTLIGERLIMPTIPRFAKRFPDVAIDLTLRDQYIDPVAEGIDVVLRVGGMTTESGLISRRLGACRVVVAGAPAYLRRRGRPRAPADLHHHDCLGFLLRGRPMDWIFREDGRTVKIRPNGRICSSSAEPLRQAAVAGLGLACLFECCFTADLAAGSLETVLERYELAPPPLYAVFAERTLLPTRVRVFLDHLAGTFGERT